VNELAGEVAGAVQRRTDVFEELAPELQIVEHWGAISDGVYVAEYQTRQPDPTHWIAVGVVTSASASADGRTPPRLLVGSGKTEEAAIHDLETRLLGDDVLIAS
jgi:hypothetical protein